MTDSDLELTQAEHVFVEDAERKATALTSAISSWLLSTPRTNGQRAAGDLLAAKAAAFVKAWDRAFPNNTQRGDIR